MYKVTSFIFGTVLLLGMVGCQTASKDYTLFHEYQPRSILVLPPLNESVDEFATYGYLSTVSQPLGEMGYYVYPVAVIDQFLKENGMPTPGEMHQVPLDKISEIIGADAVLYIVIKEYGNKYQILSSKAVVSVSARLVDVKSGIEIWSNDMRLQSTSNNSSGGLAGMLVGAVVDQIVNSKTDAPRTLSQTVNASLIRTPKQGLLYGPNHPEFSESAE